MSSGCPPQWVACMRMIQAALPGGPSLWPQHHGAGVDPAPSSVGREPASGTGNIEQANGASSGRGGFLEVAGWEPLTRSDRLIMGLHPCGRKWWPISPTEAPKQMDFLLLRDPPVDFELVVQYS